MRRNQSPNRPKYRFAILLIAYYAAGICGKLVFAEDLTALSARLQPFSSAAGSTPPAPWRIVGLPRSSKPLTRFDMVLMDGRMVLRVQTDKSYANLEHDLPDIEVPPGTVVKS